jgi:hypothetical protein
MSMLKSICLFIFFLVLFPKVLFSQNESFTYDINGIHPNFVVVELDSLDQGALYKKATQWVKTSQMTIKSSVQNDKFNFEGAKENAVCTTVMGKTSCNNVRFEVQLAFKDKKYKFDVVRLEQYGPVNQTGVKDWFDTPLDKAPDHYYTRGGELKKECVSIPDDIAGLFNDLNASLKAYLLKEHAAEKEEGW